MHQAYDTIFSSQCRQGRIHKHHFSRSNSYLEIWNGLQSVPCPFIHVTKSVRKKIFQSIVYRTVLLTLTDSLYLISELKDPRDETDCDDKFK